MHGDANQAADEAFYYFYFSHVGWSGGFPELREHPSRLPPYSSNTRNGTLPYFSIATPSATSSLASASACDVNCAPLAPSAVELLPGVVRSR